MKFIGLVLDEGGVEQEFQVKTTKKYQVSLRDVSDTCQRTHNNFRMDLEGDQKHELAGKLVDQRVEVEVKVFRAKEYDQLLQIEGTLKLLSKPEKTVAAAK